MTEETLFTAEEEQHIEEVLLRALRMKDERERERFIREQFGNNPRMLHRAMKDVREAFDGEHAQSRPLARPVLNEGEEIGNYRISTWINQGGFATVYSAEHKILRTFAAIKIFDKLISETAKGIIWNKEGKSLSKLDHDNIVRFYDLGFYEKDGKRLPYVIVELVKGKHLDQHCRERDPSVRDVLSLFRSLCDVIEYIHDKKILHLDLKPSNILVTARLHRIKLIDFGSSRLFRDELRRLTINDYFNPLSAKFASPEQIDKKEETNYQSDIYSLGAVLYLLFTEKVPFGEGASDREEIERKVTNPNLSPDLPSKRVLEIEKETKFGLSINSLSKVVEGDLDFIIMECLQKRRSNRYGRVSELIQDIDRFLEGKPLKARQKPLRPRPFGYKAFKSVSRLFGFKGGLSSWAKWKGPSRRFAVLGVLIASLGVGWYMMYRGTPLKIKTDHNLGLRVRENDKEQDKKPFEALYILCDEEPCFSFLKIAGDDFVMGKSDDEHFDPPEEEKLSLPRHQITIQGFYMGRFEIGESTGKESPWFQGFFMDGVHGRYSGGSS